jgi:hypothetical protein
MIQTLAIAGATCFMALMFKIHYKDKRILTNNEAIIGWLYIFQMILLIWATEGK